MKSYQKLLLSLSLLTFISCGSSGGGSSNLKPTVSPETSKLINSEITKNKNTMTETISTNKGKVKPTVSKIQTQKEEIVTNIDKAKSIAPKTQVPKETTSKGHIIQNLNLDKTLNQKKIGITTFKGNINIEDERLIGAIANKNVHLINDKKSTIKGIMETGMKALEKGSITNNGKIFGYINKGMSANGDNSIAINNHLIILNSNNGSQKKYNKSSNKKNIIIGMKASKGASVINGFHGKISGNFNYGMFSSNKKSKAINYGEIYFDDTYDNIKNINTKGYIGMAADEGATITNAKGGSISGRIGTGMVASGQESSAVNLGHINLIGSSSDYRINNYYFYEVRGTGMWAINGASITNAKGGSISGNLDKGMWAYDKGDSAVNEGNITIDGYYFIAGVNPISQKFKLNPQDITKDMLNRLGDGMDADEGASITNAKGGSISGNLDKGMWASGKGSSAVNEGNITKNTLNHLGDGMDADNGASITNGKTGIIQGSFLIGMLLDYNQESIGINNGTILSYGNNSEDQSLFVGMKGSENSKIINNGEIVIKDKTEKDTGYVGIYSNGTILNNGNISGDFNEGIAIDKNGVKSKLTKAINKGNIILSKNKAIGMDAEGGATAINEIDGNIYLNGKNETGMYATGKGSVIENKGNIYLSGRESKKIYGTKISSTNKNINGIDSRGNIGMKIEDGAKMINKGTIHFAQSK